MRYQVALAIALAAGGCIPLQVQQAPEVEGRLMREGTPVANTVVTYFRPDSSSVTAVTDSAGRFHFEGMRGKEWIPFILPVHCLIDWVIGVETADTTRATVGYTYGSCMAPKLVRAECDLAAPDTFCSMRFRRRGGPEVEEIAFPTRADGS